MMSWIKVSVAAKLKTGVKFYFSCINCKCFTCEGTVALWHVSPSFLQSYCSAARVSDDVKKNTTETHTLLNKTILKKSSVIMYM